MYLEVNEIIDLAKKSPGAVTIFESLKNMLDAEKMYRHKFYENVKEDQKAEFINGKIVLHSPVMLRHNETSFNLANLIRIYVQKHDLGLVGYEKLMIQLTRNDYEPDICFFCKAKSQHFKPDQLFFPTPDFVVEVLSKSTENTDRTIKFEDYQAHGVNEYWIVDPEDCIIEQYILKDNQYKLMLKSGSGKIRSIAMEGFEIPVEAIFDKTINYQILRSFL